MRAFPVTQWVRGAVPALIVERDDTGFRLALKLSSTMR